MRVVAGKFKGKNVIAPKGEAVRPTTTRIKETLFNILQMDVPQSRVLDLFAGSGSLGIESLSRGAQHVVFVDKSKDSINAIKYNLSTLSGDYDIVNSDFAAYLNSAAFIGKKFDLIFIDPPYASNMGEIAIDFILSHDLLTADGKIVFEHGSEKPYTLAAVGYKQRTKKMGTVTAEFISRKRIALMAGSYDPFTRGHEAVLDEALEMFDEVVAACLINPDKQYVFSDEQRLALAQAVCESKKGARALFSRDDAAAVAREVGACMLVRGKRGERDEKYEEDMAAYNREHGFETFFIELPIYADLSATKAREMLRAGDMSAVPPCTVELLRSKEYAARLG